MTSDLPVGYGLLFVGVSSIVCGLITARIAHYKESPHDWPFCSRGDLRHIRYRHCGFDVRPLARLRVSAPPVSTLHEDPPTVDGWRGSGRQRLGESSTTPAAVRRRVDAFCPSAVADAWRGGRLGRSAHFVVKLLISREGADRNFNESTLREDTGMAIRLTTTPPPRTQLHLFHHRPRFGVFSRFNFFAIQLRGQPLVTLELTDQSVRCSVQGKSSGHPRWLTKRLQMPDLKERLQAGPVTVFEFPRNGYEITWPKYDFGTLFQIGEPGASPWTLSFNNGKDYSHDLGLDWWRLINLAGDLSSLTQEGATAPIRAQWRQALDPQGRYAPNAP